MDTTSAFHSHLAPPSVLYLLCFLSSPPNNQWDSVGPKGVCPTTAIPAQAPAPFVSEFRFPIPDPLVQPQVSFPSVLSSLLFQSSQLWFETASSRKPAGIRPQPTHQSLPEQEQGDWWRGQHLVRGTKASWSVREAKEESRENQGGCPAGPWLPLCPGPPSCPCVSESSPPCPTRMC